MSDSILQWFSPTDFMAHGTCLIWNQDLIALHVASDSLIALSYYSIPFGLAYFVHKRTDLAYRWMFLLFAGFILACGTTHLLDIWTLWHPDYLLQGIVKFITAGISLASALLLWPVIPQALKLPSPTQLHKEMASHQNTLFLVETEAAERARAQEQLRKNEARLQAILDTAAEGIITIDHRGVVEMCNPAAADMFGYTIEEVMGRNVSLLMPPPFSESHDTYMARYFRTGHSNIIGRGRETIGRRQDGSVFPVEITVGEFESDGLRFTAVLRDITDRRRAEEALRESERRLELALMGADLVLWDWNIRTGTTFFSERLADLLGYTLEEIDPSYSGWMQLLYPDDRARVQEAQNAHLDGKTPFFEIEYRLLTKSGQWKWVLDRGKVMVRELDGQPMRAAGVLRDIDERKNLEERLQQQQADLLYVQRLTTAGELAAMIAHELNQPLGAIANYLGGASLRFHAVLEAHPALRDMMDETLRLSKRAAEVVRGIRDLVRKRELEREQVDIATLLQESLSLARSELARRQVRVLLEVPDGLPPVWGQRVHLQQLLLNLILNAMDAMENCEPGQRKLTIQAAPCSHHEIAICIRDSGKGFSPELAQRMFEPFVSTTPDGIGLGLSICRSIVEAHAGRISAQSSPVTGATFEVILPAKFGGGEHVR